MAVRKRKARERAIEKEYAENVAASRLANKEDSDLYFVDTAATLDPRKLAKRAKKAAKQQAQMSKTEMALIDKAVLKLSRRVEVRHDQHPPEGDVWADEEKEARKAHKELQQRNQRKKLVAAFGGVAVGGQSYNPKLEEHQDVLGVAVAIESRRVTRLKECERWWKARRLSCEATTEGEGANDEENEDGQAETDCKPVVRRPTEPVTRVQRNKRRRHRVTEAEVQRRRALKAQRRQLDGLKSIQEDLDREERERDSRRAALAASKAAAPRSEPTEPPQVALSDEILASDGTLRKSTSLKSPATLLHLFRDGDSFTKHLPAKKLSAERKKRPRRKFRGAKLIARYKSHWLA